MTPLFDLEPLTGRVAPAAGRRSTRENVAKPQQGDPPAPVPTPISYWVHGVFRCGDRQLTRTVQAVGMSTRIDADVARFVHYLAGEGFQLAEGRGILIQLLGIGTDDGTLLAPIALRDLQP
jgi:hypothetical protein